MFTRKSIVVISRVLIIITNTYFCHLNWEFRLTATSSCAVCQLQYLWEIPSLWGLGTLVWWVMEGRGFSGCFGVADSAPTTFPSVQIREGAQHSFPSSGMAFAWNHPRSWTLFCHEAPDAQTQRQLCSSSVGFTYKQSFHSLVISCSSPCLITGSISGRKSPNWKRGRKEC